MAACCRGPWPHAARKCCVLAAAVPTGPVVAQTRRLRCSARSSSPSWPRRTVSARHARPTGRVLRAREQVSRAPVPALVPRPHSGVRMSSIPRSKTSAPALAWYPSERGRPVHGQRTRQQQRTRLPPTPHNLGRAHLSHSHGMARAHGAQQRVRHRTHSHRTGTSRGMRTASVSIECRAFALRPVRTSGEGRASRALGSEPLFATRERASLLSSCTSQLVDRG